MAIAGAHEGGLGCACSCGGVTCSVLCGAAYCVPSVSANSGPLWCLIAGSCNSCLTGRYGSTFL